MVLLLKIRDDLGKSAFSFRSRIRRTNSSDRGEREVDIDCFDELGVHTTEV